MKKSRKIAIMGARAVGKTALLYRFLENIFTEAYLPTIESTYSKNLRLKGQEYELTIIDTAGQVQL